MSTRGDSVSRPAPSLGVLVLLALPLIGLALLLGIPQPKVSKLLSGKIDGFSVEKLLQFLLKLDRDIEISIRKHSRRDSRGKLSVRSDKDVDVIAA